MQLKADCILEQDLVLLHIDEKPAFYARVEHITADVKPKWWRVKLLMLTIPAKIVTWIIDDDQIRGAEFTMRGTPVKIERVTLAEEELAEKKETGDKKTGEKLARILSLHESKKKSKS
ncbi:MAG: hypothetical protein ACE5IR_07145 [bacterium]